MQENRDEIKQSVPNTGKYISLVWHATCVQSGAIITGSAIYFCTYAMFVFVLF